MRQAQELVVLRIMFVVVVANYLAQIPYYLDLYYLPHGAPPSLPGTAALGATFAWFLVGYILLRRGAVIGYGVLLAFIVTEFAFYLWNFAMQIVHGFPPFFHLQARDPILFVVFAIGYVNFLAGAYFIYFLVAHSRALLASGSHTPSAVGERPRATSRGA